MSPLTQIKSLERQVLGVVSKLDLAELPKEERSAVTKLRNDLIDTKLDIRDYEISDSRPAQVLMARQAKQGLDSIRTGILAVSEYNVFNAVDVAQLTARLEQIIEEVN